MKLCGDPTGQHFVPCASPHSISHHDHQHATVQTQKMHPDVSNGVRVVDSVIFGSGIENHANTA